MTIRAVEPYLTLVQPFPDWVAGDLIVSVTAAAFAQLMTGAYEGLDGRGPEARPRSRSSLRSCAVSPR